VQAAADSALPRGLSWEWNQCLMELGAVVCRPVPKCAECPLVSACAWRGVGDDPAVGSAGVSRAQSRFEGSERQARGRLMKALSDGTVPVANAASLMAHPSAPRLLQTLRDEGLVVIEDEWVRLP
jgi:A/G-specific adenine glycosylase